MPTYEYVCTNCQNQWEEIQKISDAPVTVCPKCSQSSAKRQISGGNFILKGGGWYADLYSSTGSKKSSDGAASSSSGAPSSSPSDAKPAAGASGESKAASTPPAKAS